MGQLVDGKWQDQDLPRQNVDGSFQRPDSPWRRFVEADPDAEFPAASGRYHLYVNQGCPWAYRTLLYRELKQLQDVISISFTQPARGPQGWTFLRADGTSQDSFTQLSHIHEVYSGADATFTGRATVPILWDKETGTIVNNESAEIIRMLNREFNAFTSEQTDYYPVELQAEIDALNADIYADVNNGVYRCGFATTQAAYEAAYDTLFARLEQLDRHLGERRFLCGDQITEADWRLLPTLQRFDLAYHGLFRCNERPLTDYPNLWPYARDLHQQPYVAATFSAEAFKGIYWGSRGEIIPKGPQLDWAAPHGRAAL